MIEPKEHITLIGMAGVGKSSIGKKLAQRLQKSFIDTDSLIKEQINQPLFDYIQEYSEDAFLKLEENTLCNLKLNHPTIIATGGSSIYSKKGMLYLKKISTFIYLQDSVENIINRIPNIQTRGIIKIKNQSFKELFNDRKPYYETYADITISIANPFNLYKTLEKIERLLQ